MKKLKLLFLLVSLSFSGLIFGQSTVDFYPLSAALNTGTTDGTDFTEAATGTNDRKVTTKTVTFTASGGAWSGAVHTFMGTTTDDSGKLICAAALSTTRTLQDGDSLQVSIVITLAG